MRLWVRKKSIKQNEREVVVSTAAVIRWLLIFAARSKSITVPQFSKRALQSNEVSVYLMLRLHTFRHTPTVIDEA